MKVVATFIEIDFIIELFEGLKNCGYFVRLSTTYAELLKLFVYIGFCTDYYLYLLFVFCSHVYIAIN